MSKNIEINIKNSIGYDTLYPKTTPNQAGSLDINGGTMSGPLMLNRNPVESMEAVNKGYVDSKTSYNQQQGIMMALYGIHNISNPNKLSSTKGNIAMGKTTPLVTSNSGTQQFLANVNDTLTLNGEFNLMGYSGGIFKFNVNFNTYGATSVRTPIISVSLYIKDTLIDTQEINGSVINQINNISFSYNSLSEVNSYYSNEILSYKIVYIVTSRLSTSNTLFTISAISQNNSSIEAIPFV